MFNKKIMSLMIAGVVGVTGCGISFAYQNSSQKCNSKNIKVLAYKASNTVLNQANYKIDKFSNIDALAMLSNNEVLTEKVTGVFPDVNNTGDFPLLNSHMLSIYNLDTGETRDFKDVCFFNFFGLSKDKKYALYEEDRKIPKFDSDEYKKEYVSGELFHQVVKILNLQTGEITQLKTLDMNSDDQYKWVDNNKILERGGYTNGWQIIDVNNKVYKSGSLGDKNDRGYSSGYDYGEIADFDLKISGDDISGCFYLSAQVTPNVESTKIQKYDITTGQLTPVLKSDKDVQFSKFYDNKFITRFVTDKNDRHKDTIQILNPDYSVYKNIPCNQQVLSVYTEDTSPDHSKLYFGGRFGGLQMLDLTTGTITELYHTTVANYIDVSSDGKQILFNDEANNCTYLLSFK